MAKPIPLDLPPRDPREELRAKLEQAPLEHAEAVLAGFKVLQALHDQGALDVLRGVLGGSDKIFEIIVETSKSPEVTRGIQNFLLLTKLFASIPPEVLTNLVNAVAAASNRSDTDPPPGTLQLLGKLRNEESRRAIAVALDLLESLGRRR
jgi:uncharacterized protein YjgD (DUF1641 family)